MTSDISLGATIRAARLRKAELEPRRFSVRSLATRLGASASWLSMVERDAQRPTEVMVRALAKELDLDAELLVPQAGRVAADVAAMLLERPALADAVRALGALPDEDVARAIRRIRDGEW